MIAPEALCLLMVVAVCAALLTGFPVAFVLAGVSFMFAGLGHLLGSFDPGFLTAFPQRVFAIMTNDVLVAVPLFVFMGVMLERSRIAEDLLDRMGQLFGRLPGGMAYSVTAVGALLAASTGIVGATVTTMGLLSLPAMLRRGYSPAFAAGSIAAAGTLGQIIPPSIVLILLGDQLAGAYQQAQFERGIFAPDTVSVNDLFAGALLPGLLLVGLYLFYQAGHAALRREQAPPLPERTSGARDLRGLGRVLLAPLLLVAAVLGSILGGLATPTEAASVGAVGAILLAAHRLDGGGGRFAVLAAMAGAGLVLLTVLFDLRPQRQQVSPLEWSAIAAAAGLTLLLAGGVVRAVVRTHQARAEDGVSVLVSAMRSTAQISSMVFVILIGASMFALVFRGLRGDEWVEAVLTGLPGGAVAAVLTVMLVMFVLGFFLDFLEIVFIVVPIVAPILLKMEVAPGVAMSPIWLGVMMGINLQTSFLTPPFGFALFFLRGVAPPQVRTVDIYRGIVPFVLIQLATLAVLWHVPAIATWLPGALYGA